MKLIFFDIDGTLISEKDNSMLESTKDAIKIARANGNICMVNTGRSYKLVGDWLPKLVDFDGYLCGCGTHIIYHGNTILHETFDVNTAQFIIDGLEKYKIDAVLEGSDNNYHNELDKMHTDKFRNFMKSFKKHNYGLYSEACGNYDKFYCYAPEKWQIEGFMKEYEHLLDFIDRERGFYEIAPKGFSKASAMEYIANKLEIPMEDTVAIGDSNNDLLMLRCAHTPIAMGNGNDNVKSIAKFITTDVDDNGIYNALEWLGVL